ncbi:MAG: methyltransferase domain-containing protein [Azonexus sp.]
MAHKEQQDFIEIVRASFPEYFSGKRVLEIGSLDINGSVRKLFQNCDYIGVDVAPGPGVDVVCQGQDYDGPDNSFDVAISCEVMEHNPFWAETVKNMVRLCKPGGLVVMTCATLGRREHGTARTSKVDSPLTVGLGWSYYNNLTAADFLDKQATEGLSHIFVRNWSEYDLYMVGIKGKVDSRIHAVFNKIRLEYNKIFWSSWRCIRHATKAIFLNKRN